MTTTSMSMNTFAAILNDELEGSVWHSAVLELKLKWPHPRSGELQLMAQETQIAKMIFGTSFLLKIAEYLPG